MRPFEPVDANKFKELRDWLLAKGFAPAGVVLAIGTAAQGRAIGTLADSLRAQLKSLPKSK